MASQMNLTHRLQTRLRISSPETEVAPETPAQDTVFRTVELVEEILSHLPTIEAIRLRPVCTQFKDLIDRVPVVQHAFFLKPRPRYAYLEYKRPGPGLNGWVTSYVPIEGATVPELTDDTNKLNTFAYLIGRLHPVLDNGAPSGSRSVTITTLDLNTVLTWPRDGPWRTMLATQPPMQNILVRYWWRNLDGSVRFTLTDPDGVKLGAIIDRIVEELRELVRRYGTHAFDEVRVRWRRHEKVLLDPWAVKHEVEIQVPRFLPENSRWVKNAEGTPEEVRARLNNAKRPFEFPFGRPEGMRPKIEWKECLTFDDFE